MGGTMVPHNREILHGNSDEKKISNFEEGRYLLTQLRLMYNLNSRLLY